MQKDTLMEETKFHHTQPIQLRFNDVDKFGHVNNTVYFSFYDLGKTDYFATVCPHVDWEHDGIVVVHIEVDFLAQIYSSDAIAVQTAVTEIGTKSFHLLQRVIDTRTGEVKCICRSVMVAFDLDSHEAKPLTGEWIDAICAYEGRDLRRKKLPKTE
ncbi:MAG: acyl-CoA thioesterase [Prevotellaceae bacterium]|nr:acyl-CoA thioesterase [Prevotellaceae bacterium]